MVHGAYHENCRLFFGCVIVEVFSIGVQNDDLGGAARGTGKLCKLKTEQMAALRAT
jgi:hypothetical protein